MKYKEWTIIWLENYIKPSSKLKTFVRYDEIVRQHLLPRFGEYEIENLEVIEIQKFITDLLANGNKKNGKGLSSNTVNAIITVLQGSLETAFNVGVAKIYIGKSIKRPKLTETKVMCFNQMEQHKIEQAILTGKKIKLYGVLLCLYTGLRIGELLALEWNDIDFKSEEVSVNKTCHDGKNSDGKFCHIVDKPKTISSTRIIPIPKQIIPYLKVLKKENSGKYVIEGKSECLSVRSYQKTFSCLLKQLNIDHKGFHSLRHTFATRALECGMDVKTLSEILGHKSPNVTLNRYVHSMMEHKKAMMDKVGKLL